MNKRIRKKRGKLPLLKYSPYGFPCGPCTVKQYKIHNDWFTEIWRYGILTVTFITYEKPTKRFIKAFIDNNMHKLMMWTLPTKCGQILRQHPLDPNILVFPYFDFSGVLPLSELKIGENVEPAQPKEFQTINIREVLKRYSM